MSPLCILDDKIIGFEIGGNCEAEEIIKNPRRKDLNTMHLNNNMTHIQVGIGIRNEIGMKDSNIPYDVKTTNRRTNGKLTKEVCSETRVKLAVETFKPLKPPGVDFFQHYFSEV